MLYPSMLEFSIFPERTINSILDYDEVATIWTGDDACVIIFSGKEYDCLRKLCDSPDRDRGQKQESFTAFLKDPKITIDYVTGNEAVVFLPVRGEEGIVILCEKEYKVLLGTLACGTPDDYI
jgi:hypothetical protein